MKKLFVALAFLCATSSAWADPIYDIGQFTAYENDGTTALQAGKYAQAEAAFASAVRYSPQQAGGYYNLAAAAAHAGDSAKALAALQQFAAFGFYVDLETAADFASLRGNPEFAAIRHKIEANTTPVCFCKSLFQGSAESFIAEGVANDLRNDRIFVASIAQRKIVAIQNGALRDFAKLPDGMSPLGIRINAAHDLVWVAASTLPQSDGGDGDMGNAALLAFDITSGVQRFRFNAPVYASKRSFSDMTFAQDGTAYVSDAIEGSIFRWKPGTDALEQISGAGRFSSPQGMVVSADGRAILVADYAAGLQKLDIESGDVTSVEVPAGITTLGMDGLVQLRDGSFAATQNGIRPNRIVRFRLSQDWTRLQSFSAVARGTADVADLSLLTTDGNDLLVVGVSQWNSFGDGPTPEKPLKPWRVMRVSLP